MHNVAVEAEHCGQGYIYSFQNYFFGLFQMLYSMSEIWSRKNNVADIGETDHQPAMYILIY